MKQMNDEMKKLNFETDKVFNKYLKARKIAQDLKNIVEDQTRLLKQRNEQYLQIVQEIKKNVYSVLIGKVVKADKITELIKKSKKNIVHIGDLLTNDKVNAVMLEID